MKNYFINKTSRNEGLEWMLLRLVEVEVFSKRILQDDGELAKYVTNSISLVTWMAASRLLCDCRIPRILKDNFYRMAVRLAMMYGSKCWVVKKQHTQRMDIVEMRILI